MRGPQPIHCPAFPADFWAQARQISRRPTAPAAQRQRAALVCLLQEEPLLAHAQAADRVGLHPVSVRRGRRRWAGGDFSREDQPGRGRTPTFSPPGPGRRPSDRL
jgi:hypothetical protein